MPTSPIHPSSLVNTSLHSQALLELIQLNLSQPVINYLVDSVVDTVNYAMGVPSTSNNNRTSFTTFVTNVIYRAEVTMPTILGSLVYIDRAKPHLHIALEQWALERVFLGALISASKYLNDSTLKNVHWAMCTGIFGKRDVGRIEREFLDVLNFQLGIAEDDILSHHDGLSALSLPTHSHRLAGSQSHLLHTRVQRHDGVPGLSPSSSSQPSSSSSSGLSSPRTPPPARIETDSAPTHKRPSSSITMSVSPPPSANTKKSLHMSTLDLLRAFPIPIPSQYPRDRYHATLHPHHHSTSVSAPAPPLPPRRMQLCA